MTPNKFNITEQTFPEFRNQVRKGIESYSGSPCKKEGKLNETCAIILGKENTDQMFAAFKNYNAITPLTMINEALCPFCGSHETEYQARNSEGHQYADCDCGASWIEYSKEEDQAKDEAVPVHAISILSFPTGIAHHDMIKWFNIHVDQSKILYHNELNEDGLPLEPMPSDIEHWHIGVAGYRKALNDTSWFPSKEELNEVGMKDTLLAYWNTAKDNTHYLAENLSEAIHYEFRASTDKDTGFCTLNLYKIFKVQNEWTLSLEGKMKLDADVSSTQFAADVSRFKDSAMTNEEMSASSVDTIIGTSIINPSLGLPHFSSESAAQVFCNSLYYTAFKTIKSHNEAVDLRKSFISLFELLYSSCFDKKMNQVGFIRYQFKYSKPIYSI